MLQLYLVLPFYYSLSYVKLRFWQLIDNKRMMMMMNVRLQDVDTATDSNIHATVSNHLAEFTKTSRTKPRQKQPGVAVIAVCTACQRRRSVVKSRGSGSVRSSHQTMGGARGSRGGQLPPCALLPAPGCPPLVRIMILGALQGFSIFFFVKSNWMLWNFFSLHTLSTECLIPIID